MATALVTERLDTQPPFAEADLLAGIRRGDARAARDFYDRFAERAYRAAYRVLRDRTAAEEVTQDTFVKAFDSIEQLREVRAAGAWLTAIAVRLSYDAVRARRRQDRRLVPLEAVRMPSARPEPDPLVAEHVRDAIARLSTKLQTVLVMFELEGYSHAEIAAALGIPEATSKTRLFQARAALRDALQAYREPETEA